MIPSCISIDSWRAAEVSQNGDQRAVQHIPVGQILQQTAAGQVEFRQQTRFQAGEVVAMRVPRRVRIRSP